MTVPAQNRLARLRRGLIEEQRGLIAPGMLDCCAHMLLFLDEPARLRDIALEHLLQRLNASRVDLGFGSPFDRTYQASASARRTGAVPEVVGRGLPNQHGGLQIVWRTRGVVTLDVDRDQVLVGLRPVLRDLGVRSKMARRLDDDDALGIVCVDRDEVGVRWHPDEVRYLDAFACRVLSPILREMRCVGGRASGTDALTAVERAVARLASEGLSYKMIAQRLGKSPNTIDNQLRRIRAKLGVQNQVGLARAWAEASDEMPSRARAPGAPNPIDGSPSVWCEAVHRS